MYESEKAGCPRRMCLRSAEGTDLSQNVSVGRNDHDLQGHRSCSKAKETLHVEGITGKSGRVAGGEKSESQFAHSTECITSNGSFPLLQQPCSGRLCSAPLKAGYNESSAS
jgi:hypothetical protein